MKLSKKISVKLTKREKILLALLFLSISFYGYMQFLVNPQLTKLNELKIEKQAYEVEMKNLEDASALEKQLDDTILNLSQQISLISDNYFTNTEQEEIILLLNEFLNNPDVKASSISFTPPAIIILPEEHQASLMNATLTYEGSYETLMELLDSIWNFKKQIIVENININKNEQSQVTGNILLNFYNLGNLTNQTDAMFEWYIDEEFYKENPFSSIAENGGFRVNYMYVGKDAASLDTTVYKPFIDISDHWAEDEIESFGREGYVRGDQNNQFKPDNPITRGEFVMLQDRVYQWPIPEEKVDLTKFSDYSALGNYESSMAKAIFKGYLGGFLKGYTDNTLKPSSPITYQEVVYIMRRIKGDDNFGWEDVAEKMNTEKGILSKGLENIEGFITKAEAVYLLYHFK